MVKKTNKSRALGGTVWCLFVLLFAGKASVDAAGDGGYAAPYFQADFIQSLSEWTSPLVNPALLYRVNQKHLEYGSYNYALLAEGMGYQQAGLLWPYLRNHTFGLTSLWSLNVIDQVKLNKAQKTYYKDGTTAFEDIWFIGSYSYRIVPWLTLGTNLKFRLEKQFEEPWSVSSVPGLDLGAYFNPLDNYRDFIGDFGFSVSIQDLLPTTVNWETIDTTKGKEISKEFTVNRIRAGMRWAGFNDNFVWDGECVIDNGLIGLYKGWPEYANMFLADSSSDTAKAHIKKMAGELVATPRFGTHFKILFIPQVWFKFGWTNNNFPYIGFNYNLIYLLPEMINYVNIDAHIGYSFLDRYGNTRDERGFSLMFKGSTDFGQTREQILSKRLYERLIVAPMDAYNEAMRLYLQEKYFEAQRVFGKVVALYPNFHLNDKAKWYLGDCYTKLYLNDISREVFKQALEEFTTSEQRARYIYGLERLDYREGKHDDALKNHAFIINLYPESDIRSDADYLAGEIQYERKNYNVAEQLFSSLKPGDPSYLYAQYTLAIINVENNKEQTAIENLTTIIKDSTQESSDQLLQDAANLKIGHIYYESGDKLRQAVEAYGRVPDGSSFQDEALLGTAWSWMKGNRPLEAVQTCDRLIFNIAESALVPEAFLVKGYGLMILKRWAEAVNALEQCVTACERSFVTDEDLQKRKAKFEEYQTTFSPTSQKILKNTLKRPTNKTNEEWPDLFREYQKYDKESRDAFRYALQAKSHARFFKRKSDILGDAKYALAKATNNLKSKAINKDLMKSDEETKKLDEELKKNKEELEKINE